jgi:hypothetical protein
MTMLLPSVNELQIHMIRTEFKTPHADGSTELTHKNLDDCLLSCLSCCCIEKSIPGIHMIWKGVLVVGEVVAQTNAAAEIAAGKPQQQPQVPPELLPE